MNKGIVMQITSKHLIIMRADGRFERVSRRKRTCQIGEEIEYDKPGVNWRSSSVAGKSAIAAAVVFCLVVFASFNGKLGSPEIVAYITMDINPSVEIGIDVQENVLELRGLNEDGNLLIEAVEFKGRNLEQVTERLLDNAEREALAKGEGEIVIASTVILPDSKVNDESIAERLKQQVTKHIETTHPQQANQYQVAAFAAPKEVREAASQNGVSTGKYSVYLNAKSSGADVTLEEIKKESVLQIAKNKPEVAQSIQPSRVPTKSDLKQLVEEEKTGELDKKVNEKKGSAKNSPDPNGKNQTGAKAGKGQTQSDRDGKNSQSGTRNGTSSGGKDDPKKTTSSQSKNGNSRDDDDDDDDRKGSRNTRDDDKKDNGKTSSGSGSKPGTSGSGGSRGRDDDDDRKQEEVKRGDEAKRAEEARKKAEEQRKKQEAERKKQEENRKKQEEERKKQEELRKKQEAERKKAEELKKQQEEEASKKKEAERKKQEEEKRKKDEAERKKQEAERKKQEEQRKRTERSDD
ncbi:Anti-sigma factor N-terminus [Paenibacillus sp. UNCCL117]|uniref:anti-sigma-I factor RsgI family protein n=1 Tax=unclassified Paenibacillus TaxID=185978 RepID=UPI000888D6EC|nr:MULTISPECIES: anti-sigma factor domain-containing protein [unclassified Paenibacillus]SDE23470.1 Anti-sigma factor N-terminus [Paenibacillus sp. cl123]SFW42590.1 Anti-sigma factor N-terminus [Paenibacillus sp. UNCCL117]